MRSSTGSAHEVGPYHNSGVVIGERDRIPPFAFLRSVAGARFRAEAGRFVAGGRLWSATSRRRGSAAAGGAERGRRGGHLPGGELDGGGGLVHEHPQPVGVPRGSAPAPGAEGRAPAIGHLEDGRVATE